MLPDDLIQSVSDFIIKVFTLCQWMTFCKYDKKTAFDASTRIQAGPSGAHIIVLC